MNTNDVPDDLPQDLLPASAAAKLLNIRPATLHRWRLQGRVRAWRLIGRWRFSRSELLALAEPYRPDATPVPVLHPERGWRYKKALAYLEAHGL